MLYDMTDGKLMAVSQTTFQAEQVLERTHLQAPVRDGIDVLGDDLLVVAKDLGDFEDTHRRIHLLCVDRSARLIVVELKRTEDGGHFELQALRYAAMVSVMTFEELVQTYARHLVATKEGTLDHEGVRTRLLEWLDDVDDDEPVINREAGIVLASASFSQEITPTVLWLNKFYGTDIRCMRRSPYRHDGRLLVDVQQVIPRPEVAELTVRLKKREAAPKRANERSKDYTKFVVTSPEGGVSPPLPKRRAVLAPVKALHCERIPAQAVAEAIPHSKLRAVPGTLTGDEPWSAFAAQHDLGLHLRMRWFVDEPIHDDGATWLLSYRWVRQTESALRARLNLAPAGYACEAAT